MDAQNQMIRKLLTLQLPHNIKCCHTYNKQVMRPSVCTGNLALQQKLEAREKRLAEREFILSQTQKLAKVGSWNFDRSTQRTSWSTEMYNIHGLNSDFDTDNYMSVLELYDDNSRTLILDAGKAMYETKQSFDITARIITPLGYKKWVKVVAHPVIKSGEVTGMIGLTYDITASKEAEEIIKESEEKFASAFRNNPDLMVITREEDMLVMDLNEKVLPVLGYTREEVIGRYSGDFKFYVNPSDRDKFFSEYRANGQAEIECPWFKKNGDIVHVIITSKRLHIKGVANFITVIRDISARKVAEEKFQKAFALSPDLILLVRVKDLIVIDANNKLLDIAGYEREDIVGKSTNDFNMWKDQSERKQFFDQLHAGDASSESKLIKKNGEEFYAAINARTMELAGEPHMICVIRDITERKEAQDKIHESEINLSAIINNTDMEIWSVDKDLRIIAVNENFRKSMKVHYAADLALNTDLAVEFKGKLEPHKFEQWINLYKMALSGGTVALTDKRKNETFQYSLHPIYKDGGITGLTCYAKNITDDLHKQDELKEADKRISELQLSTLRSFMNPHFIFNALNSIQFFISKNERTKAIEYLSTFSTLIRQVLASAQRNNISLTDELEMLRHYVDIEKLRFNNNFDLVLKVDSNLTLSDIQIPSLLIQPFVENAIIHGFSNLSHKGLITVSINRKDSYLVITIIDNGVGRHAARKLITSEFMKHESSAVSITEERLRLINKNNAVSINYEDINEAGASGTKVTISVRCEKFN
jgi:PAS domain S-box-containing protein